MSQQELAQKLTSDLKVVVDKARLCREMLPESPGIASDPALAEVVGYLEACRDRLMDLIEAGTMGMLDEEVLELCLKTNDVVCRTLEAEMVGRCACSHWDICHSDILSVCGECRTASRCLNWRTSTRS